MNTALRLFSLLLAVSLWVRLKLAQKITALYCCPNCGVFYATVGFTLDDGDSNTTECLRCLLSRR